MNTFNILFYLTPKTYMYHRTNKTTWSKIMQNCLHKFEKITQFLIIMLVQFNTSLPPTPKKFFLRFHTSFLPGIPSWGCPWAQRGWRGRSGAPGRWWSGPVCHGPCSGSPPLETSGSYTPSTRSYWKIKTNFRKFAFVIFV